MNSLLDIARALLHCPSVTPEDAGAQELVSTFLQQSGFKVESFPIETNPNLWAQFGSAGKTFAFSGHTDVVPPGDESKWRHPPFSATVEGDTLYARGACDMKGNIAAFLWAIKRFVEEVSTPRFTLGVMIAGDEEAGDNSGTAEILKQLSLTKRRVDYCIVTEPTTVKTLGDMIKNGRRGALCGTLTVTGTQGHSAYPHRADNPIHRVLAALAELAQVVWDSGDQYFDPTTLQITNINSGTGASNVIPGSLSAVFDIRYSPVHSVEYFDAACRKTFDKMGAKYELSWRNSAQPFVTKPGLLSEIVTASIKKICGIDTVLSTSGGTSDARFIAPTGAEVIEFGLNGATAHQVNEQLSIREMERLSDTYLEILRRFDASL